MEEDVEKEIRDGRKNESTSRNGMSNAGTSRQDSEYHVIEPHHGRADRSHSRSMRPRSFLDSERESIAREIGGVEKSDREADPRPTRHESPYRPHYEPVVDQIIPPQDPHIYNENYPEQNRYRSVSPPQYHSSQIPSGNYQYQHPVSSYPPFPPEYPSNSPSNFRPQFFTQHGPPYYSQFPPQFNPYYPPHYPPGYGSAGSPPHQQASHNYQGESHHDDPPRVQEAQGNKQNEMSSQTNSTQQPQFTPAPAPQNSLDSRPYPAYGCYPPFYTPRKKKYLGISAGAWVLMVIGGLFCLIMFVAIMIP